ncbi:MAG: bifunctional UDP-N-acetylglucosamine diphosphorylase/glucosamine-1-phosphate N-acetyltransferase GlmU [Pseudomonadota bacterium]
MSAQNARAATAIVLLAAGKGTRMRSTRPKVLHEIAGQPMLHFAIRAAITLAPQRIALVVGQDAQAVANSARSLAPEVEICLQREQLGTGHAVRMAEGALSDFDGQLIVLFGDTPFLSAATMAKLIETPEAITVLGFQTDSPGRYGRLVMDGEALLRITEAKDATPDELQIKTCNSGVMAGPAKTIFRLLSQLTSENAQGEYYLTDLPALARAEGVLTRAVFCDIAETLGINDRIDLAAAEAAFQTRARAQAMAAGATLIAPETVHFSWDTVLGQDVVIEPNVVFGPGVEIADDVTIRAFSHLAETRIAPGVSIGPFARLRGGTEIAEGAYIGNFVEMKKADFGPGAKASHLTYVGDAEVGAEANLGAGTITCNYDGVSKHRTQIGARAFIGTNTALVAPVKIGEDAYTATGSVVTKDVPPGDLAIARGRQENKPGLARKLRQRLLGLKAAKE